MLATVLLTQRGTPTIYQGDEIGMTNCHFDSIDEFNDVQVLNAYKALVGHGKVSETAFLESVNYIARDHARTPMQWSDEPHAGFTTGNPWLKVNPNYNRINVADQQNRTNSVLSFYKELLHWRRQQPAMHEGAYRDLLPDHSALWVYERRLGDAVLVVVANFSDQPIAKPAGLPANVILSNYTNASAELRPFEAVILGS